MVPGTFDIALGGGMLFSGVRGLMRKKKSDWEPWIYVTMCIVGAGLAQNGLKQAFPQVSLPSGDVEVNP